MHSDDIYHPDYRPPGYDEKDDAIELVPYCQDWPQMAQTEIQTIQASLPHFAIIDIQHVGSTAIPGVSAKPIIDIQIAVTSLTDIRQPAILSLEALGYVFWYGNPDKERMLFMKGLPPMGQGRTHHIHIYEHTCHHWHDKLFFRDYLRTHPEAVSGYIALKSKLAKQYRYDREQYTDSKTDFVNEILGYRNE